MTASFDATTFANRVLHALHPRQLFPNLIRIERDAIRIRDQSFRLDDVRGVTVLGLGKAAVAQVTAVRELLTSAIGDAFDIPRGLAITKAGHAESHDAVEVFESSHPVCDDRSRRAGDLLIERVQAVPADHLLILCLSGGGSALAIAPRPPLTVYELTRSIRKQLQRGTGIAATNLVRQEMSLLKNGGLLRHVKARRVLTLVTVDVPNDDLALVASGPTAWREHDPAAIASAARASLPDDLAALVLRLLADPTRTAWQNELREAAARVDAPLVAVGDWQVLAGVAERELRTCGIPQLTTISRPLDQTLDEAIATIVDGMGELMHGPRSTAHISGGELTVEVRGPGRGGRNTEFVLRMARALFHERLSTLTDDDLDRLTILSLATDGTDGPTDAAGGWLTRALVGDSPTARHELDDALHASDSLSYLERRDAAFRTGPTGTNLMDLRVLVLE